MSNKLHSRAHIRLENQNEVVDLIQALSKYEDQFTIENTNATRRVNAKSVIGVMYTMLDFPDGLYLVNDTRDGFIPACIDSFRIHE